MRREFPSYNNRERFAKFDTEESDDGEDNGVSSGMPRLPPAFSDRRLLPHFFKVTTAVTPQRVGDPPLADKRFIMKLRTEGCKERPFYHIVITKVI